MPIKSREEYEKRYTAFHGGKYDKRWSTEFDQDNMRQLFRYCKKVREKTRLKGRKILEIGCGGGKNLFRMSSFNTSVGIDIRLERLTTAMQTFPSLFFCCSNSFPLPFRNDTFDIVFQFVTFSSILAQKLKMDICNEIIRVLKPGGLFLWYDYRYPNPFNPFTTYETKRKIRKYFPNVDLSLHTMTVIPQLGRVLYRNAPRLFVFLNKISLFHSHYFGWFIKKDTYLKQ